MNKYFFGGNQDMQSESGEALPSTAPVDDPFATSYNEHIYVQRQRRSGKFGAFLGGVAIGVVCCLLTGIIGGVIVSASLNKRIDEALAGKRDVNITVVSAQPTENDDSQLSYSQLAAKLRRAVVGVAVYASAYGWIDSRYSQGSGFIIASSANWAYVVTNSHVLQDSDYTKFTVTVTVEDKNGEAAEHNCTVVGVDTKSDLAVLRFDASDVDIVLAEIGDSTKLAIGDEVIAIGNPGGEQFAGSVTNGIVSGVDRIIDNVFTSDTAMKYIQTNAAINPGNSGGPLADMYGRVIGINTAKIISEGYEGLGFAIPMDYALPIIEQLIESGSVKRPSLGITCITVSAETAELYGVPAGLLIKSISANSTLDEAGIAVDDIITGCEGTVIESVSELQAIIEEKEIGDKITLTVYRESSGESFEAEITLIASEG